MGVLLSVEKNFNAAMSSLNVSNTILNDVPLLPKCYNPPNKHISPKQGFFSTKKRTSKPHKRIAKPSLGEKNHIKEALAQQLPIYCIRRSNSASKAIYNYI